MPAPIRRVVRAAGFAAVTGVMLPAYAARDAVATSDAERSAVRDRWVKRWSRALLRLFAIDLEVYGDLRQARPGFGAGARSERGARSPNEERVGRLVVSNHRSAADIGIMLSTFGGHMVSRADLSAWPLVGAAARKAGTVFVDREDVASGATAIRVIRQLLKQGETICIFPEGTTFDGDEVRPFHPGAFVAALRTHAEVIPVGLAYARGSGAAFVNETFLKHLSRMAQASATRVAACVGAPIGIGDRARAAEVRDRVHAAVKELVLEARARCEGT